MRKNVKKLVSVTVALLLVAVVPLSASALWFNPFKDVKSTDWYYEAVEYVNTQGLFNGTGTNEFSPNASMTRGMFVTVLGKAAKMDTSAYGTSQFKDVPGDAYYAPYVTWAAEVGVVNGTSPNTFSPNNSITREDMATMLYKYARAYGYDTSYDEANLLAFPDAGKISSYAQVPMVWAVTQGVLAGSDGYLNPKGYATRAETAQIFYNSRNVFSTKVEDPTLDRVWVVDVPGHYETVERQELVEVTVGEEGHWEDIMMADRVWKCNTCGYEAKSHEEIDKHLVDSIVWTDEGATGCGGYTITVGEPYPSGQKQWVVDKPGHTEYQWQIITEEVWVEEVGHWEYR